MGNRSSFGLHPPLLIQTFQDDHDLETELYPVEYLAGQRLLAGTADYRNLFQHRIQRWFLDKRTRALSPWILRIFHRIRTHIFLGQRVRFDVPEKYRKFSKSITAFYEISTCDLYVVSAFNNSYLKPDDYLRLSFWIEISDILIKSWGCFSIFSLFLGILLW